MWTEGGAQPALEQATGLTFGYPALVAVSVEKKVTQTVSLFSAASLDMTMFWSWHFCCGTLESVGGSRELSATCVGVPYGRGALVWLVGHLACCGHM